ncbi:SDR family NAD(P)-dependent oxidoreductase [Streptomyces sp. NPDC096048]|uniref:SDR family NAD(P)-dependent oxidoreductase n=1 Tax=Streptomyces sp. NPDC096048 TaxID=3366072 RepID=UPI00381D2366
MPSTSASRFRVTRADVEAFGQASGDHSPLHMDEAYTRRTSFGQRVVHGALGVLHALAALPGPADGRVPVAVRARFHAPLFTGQEYTAVAEVDIPRTTVRVLDGGRPLLDLELENGTRPSGTLPTAPADTRRRTEAADRPLDDLAEGHLDAAYDPDEAAYTRLLGTTGAAACGVTVELAALLGWASYLVGMEAPGRRALASGYTVRLLDEEPADEPGAKARITAVDHRFGRVELAGRVTGTGLTGTVEAEALVRAEVPAPQPERVREQLGGTGTALTGQVGLVVGASRGLGAALAQALVLQGATVYGGFHRSRTDAEAVRQGLGEAADRLRLVQGDWSDPRWCAEARERILSEQGRLDILVLSACPPVTALGLDTAAADRVDAYVMASLALVRGPLSCFAEDLTGTGGCVLAVSSHWVTEPPAGRAHYVAAKCAVEGLMRGAAVEYPSVRFLVARPPRLATSLSGGIVGQDAGAPVEPVAAALVRRVVDRTTQPGRAHILDTFGTQDPRSGGADATTPARTAVPAPPDPQNEQAAGRGPALVTAATFTTDPLLPVLAYWNEHLGLGLRIELAPYGQVFQELLDPASAFHSNTGGCNAVLLRLEDWLAGDGGLSTIAADFVAAVTAYTRQGGAQLIVHLCPPTPGADAVRRRALDAAQDTVTRGLAELRGVHLAGGEQWGGGFETAEHHDRARLAHAHIPYTDAACTAVGTALMRSVHGLLAPPFKVLVLDCDNTLWRGVCGEDGPDGITLDDAHLELQRWALRLRERGVLLCLASKNDEDGVFEVFRRRTDMPLRQEHLAAWRIGWEPKPGGLVALARELGLGLDSFVFLDDNPVEIAAVRAACPQVLALTFPADRPERLPGMLERVWAFDRPEVTAEDLGRAADYSARRRRDELRDSSLTFADFIESLGLVVDVRPAADADLPRVSQLTHRTNQFNFSTIRRTEAELRALLATEGEDVRCWVAEVRDRFGDYGIMATALTRRTHGSDTVVVDTFLMSCRVLGRGAEHALLSHLGAAAREDGAEFLEALYRRTPRNEPARAFLEAVAGHGTAHDDGGVLHRMPVAHAAAVAFRPEESERQDTGGERQDPSMTAADPARLAALTELAEDLTDLAALRARVHGTEEGPGLAAGPLTGSSAPGPVGSGLESVRALVQETFTRTLARPQVPVTSDATFEALRLTSLDIVNLTVALEKRLGRELPTTLLFEHRTVDGLVRALAGAPHETPLAAPPALPAARSADSTPSAGEPATSHEPVAVIGLAGRYPQAATVDELWELLAEGRSAVRELSAQRWEHSRHLAADGGADTTYSAWAALLEDVDRFDAQFFRIAPREAEAMDPQQRLFLEVAHEAVEDAGYTRAGLGPQVGVYVGVMANDYAALSRSAAVTGDGPFPYAENYQIANRVSYHFDFTGPSLAVDTACSASAVAVHLACEAIRRGEATAALAGGVNLVLHPARHIQYAQMGMLSRDGRCRPFGADADGFVMGEGVGAVLLKPLSRALADGDHVHGVIKGSWTNSGGRTSGFTVPNPRAQAELVSRALTAAGVPPRTVSYVEAHGSGTALGDPIEIRGLTTAFGDPAANEPDQVGWCAVGSVKSAIGHLEPAAGIAGLTKVLLQLRHRTLAPTLHADTLNPHIDFDRTPFRVQRELGDWRRPEGPHGPLPLRAGVSSFGAGGVNAHLVVEEAPATAVPEPAGTGPELIVVSAADSARLRAYARRLHTHVTAGPGRAARLVDIAHTLRVGREPLAQRAAFVVADHAELADRLAALAGPDEASAIAYGRADGEASLADVFTDGEETTDFLARLVAGGEPGRVGRLWTRGAVADWETLFGHTGGRRVSLPTRPFRPTRYWLEGTHLGIAAPMPAAAREGRDASVWYLRAAWRAIPMPAPAPTTTERTSVVALAGGGWRPEDPAVTVVRSEDDVVRAVGEAVPGRRVTVLDGRRLGAGALSDDPLRLPTALARACAASGVPVTYAGLCLPAAADPMGAALPGLTRSAEQEIPGFRGVHIEVAGGAADVPAAADLLAAAGGPGTEVRFADGRHWTRVLEPLEHGPDAPAAPWRERGVYLVTGGAGGIGRILAERLARTHHASLILLGRGPARAGTGRLVSRIEELGGRALYVSADVCDRAALAAAVAAGEERFGPLNGVLHAAGVVEDAALRDKSDASSARVLAPKTIGTRLLDEVTADRELDFFCLMSSVSGTLGNAGQSDYAAANRHLDAFASWRDARVTAGERHGVSMSVAWPHWRDGGMSAPAAALALAETTTGLRTMDGETGLRALDAVLASGPGCTVVGVGDRERFTAAFAGTPPNAPGPAPVAPQDDRAAPRLRDSLLDIAATLLKAPREEIDADTEWGAFGFNSVLFTQFCQRINTAFGTALTPVVFYEHPTLVQLTAALSAHETVRRALTDQPTAEAHPAQAAGTDTRPAAPAPALPGPAPHPVPAPGEREPIAVVGMAGRFPGAPDLETYFEQLMAGHDAVREVDPERWDWRATAAREHCRYGGFLDDVDAFDADFFGISQREARTMDPQQRLFLETGWSALEHAGYDPRSLSGSRTGVFVGVTLHDWLDVLRGNDEPPAAHTVTGNVHSIVPNRVSHLLDLRGPSEAIDTACSSSLAAVHRAVIALRSGECDLALAGGVNALLSVEVYESLAKAGMLSPTGHCHAFGDAADGYVRGEGVGAVVLKRLSAALADGDTVHGVVLGTAVNHGGRGHSLTAPQPSAQADVVVEAVGAAGVPAAGITYVETHGTGTELGDPVEVSGLKEAFTRLGAAEGFPGGCALGAVKANIGHLESAAGIASLLKVLLAMRYRTLPPNLYADPPNRHLDLTDSPFRLLDTAEPWKPPAGADTAAPPLRAGVSSFGFGGSNAHVVLEEPPLTPVPVIEKPAGQTVILSARDSGRLRAYAQRLRDTLAAPDEADLPALADLAYTTQTGRPHLESRVALVAESVEQLRDRLDRFLTTGDGPGVYPGTGAAGPGAVPGAETADPHALAAAWAAGESVDWSAAHAGRPRRRVPLPTYPFDHTRRHGPSREPRSHCGDARPGPRRDAPTVAPRTTPRTSPRTGVDGGRHPVLVERRWTPLHTSRQPPRRRLTCLLVLRGPESLGVIGSLEESIDWIMLRERSGLPRLLPPEHEYELDYDDHADGAAVAAALLARHTRVDAVLDLVDLAGPPDPGAMGEDSGLGHEAGRVALLQALVRQAVGAAPGAPHSTGSDLNIVHVTRGLAAHRNPRPGTRGARMAALVRAVGSEYSAVRATTLDLEGDTGPVDALPLAVREIETAGEEPEVCLRGNVRHAPRLVDLPPEPAHEPGPGMFGGFAVDPDRVYLITGGTGGLGAALARELFARGARRFAVTGRRLLPPVEEWTADGAAHGLPNGIADLVELRDRGARFAAYGGALTDRAAVEDFLDGVRAGLGPIAAVVHCAGSVDQHQPVFLRKTWADVARTWEPKGEGVVVLDGLLAADEPDFVVLYSSLSAALPFLSTGLADYGSANAYLDAFAARAARRGSRTRYLSIAWGGWSGAGMGEVRSPRYTEQGFASLTHDEGIGLLEQALRRAPGPNVIALARDRNTDAAPAVRFVPSGAPPGPGRDIQEPSGGLLPLVVGAVRDLIAQEVLLPRARVAPDVHFSDLGVDSILLAGIVTRLEALTGEPVAPSTVLEYPTAAGLGAHLLQQYPQGLAACAADGLLPAEPNDAPQSAEENRGEPEAARENRSEPEAAERRGGVATTAVHRRAPVPTAHQDAHERQAPGPVSAPLAIIGMASRFPGAPTTEAFWELLRTGHDAVREVPATRWSGSRLYTPTITPGRSSSKWGGFIDDIEAYDPAYFGIPDADAAHVDPVIRLVLECAEQTIRDAGYERHELSGRRVGVFAGAGTTNYGLRIPEPGRATVTGLNPNFIGARIAHVHDFGGPNMVVDTACSSSLTALWLARQALLLGECEVALVAGADLLLDHVPYLKLSAAEALSPTGRCRVFDKDADGFVPGEGAGAVLLKPLAAALADGDRIHAVLESVAMNNDGRTMGLTTPNPAAQERVVRDALRMAGAVPDSVSYVEAHGTGTMIGDPMELRALTRAFRSDTDASGFCAIGSVKSNIGHLLMASGMAGLHKVVLALRHRQLPPTLHCREPNPRFAFDTSPFYPNVELRDWTPRSGLRRAGLSSFGFGGTNCHAILREPYADERGAAVRAPLPPAEFHRVRHWIDVEPATGTTSVLAAAPAADADPAAQAAANADAPPRGRRYLELAEDEPTLTASHRIPAHRPYLPLEELS